MRIFAIVTLTAFGFSSFNSLAHAAPSNACKQCREQQRACLGNYSAKTCKTEYDICVKACQKK